MKFKKPYTKGNHKTQNFYEHVEQNPSWWLLGNNLELNNSKHAVSKQNLQ